MDKIFTNKLNLERRERPVKQGGFEGGGDSKIEPTSLGDKMMDRRKFLKILAGSSIGLAAESVLPETVKAGADEMAKRELERKDGREKIENAEALLSAFAEQINAELENEPYFDEKNPKDKRTQAMKANLSHIYNKLAEDRNLLDEETFGLFAKLSHSYDSQANFDKSLSAVVNRLAELGFYFNYTNRYENEVAKNDLYYKSGEKVFVRGELEKKKLADYEGIAKIFPEARKYYSKIFRVTKDNLYGQGYTEPTSGLPIISEKRIFDAQKKMFDDSRPESVFWKIDLVDDFIKTVEANEFTHQILEKLYNFNNSTQKNWDDFESALGKGGLENSAQANEFLSDAVSINTAPHSMLIMQARNLLIRELSIQAEKGTGREGRNFKLSKNYKYSIDFFKNQLSNLVPSEQMESEFSTWAEDFNRLPNDAVQIEDFLSEKTRLILSKIDPGKIEQIQKDYKTEAENILKAIRESN
ncbi:MAG TPA: hypothetical protein GX706_04000 [Candidatus Moranbacteria bacterium]|nr:hypothetical protein [Candidatus Moranbacteria bacterium]